MGDSAKGESTNDALAVALVASCQDGVISKSLAGLVTLWNPAAAKMFGYTEEEVVGRNGSFLIPAERESNELELLTRIRDGIEVASYESLRLTKDGRTLDVSITPSPIVDRYGQVIGTSEIVRDITSNKRQEVAEQRKNAEVERLYAAARRLSSSLNRRELCLAFRDIVRGALPCDGVTISTFDAERSEIRCAYMWSGSVDIDPETLPPVRYDPAGAGMQTEVIRTAQSRIFDVAQRVAQPGGTYIEVDPEGSYRDLKSQSAAPPSSRTAAMVPICLDGRVLGVVQVMSHAQNAYGSDDLAALEALAAPLAIAIQNVALFDAVQRELAERLEIENALRAGEERYRLLAEDLEVRVRQRTEDLQKAVDELTGFSYSVSHDMRAPIRAIISTGRILIDDFGDRVEPPMLRELNRQVAAGKRLGALVDDLLTYARLGQREAEPEPVDFSAIAREVSERNSQPGWPCEQADIRIETGMRAKCDAYLLEILLSILIENAGKYRRPETNPRIVVRSFLNEGEVVFCVEDDGIGFESQYAERIFRPFERLHRDDAYPGTGIGLANARRIVQRHGGRIWAESIGPELGATFLFTLP